MSDKDTTETVEDEKTTAEELTEQEENVELEEEEEHDSDIPKGSKEAVLRDLARERDKRQKAEAALAEAQAKLESDEERAAREAREEIESEAEQRWKARVVRTEAKVALREAGLTGNIDRAIRLLDTDALEFTEDDEVEGLEDQIEQLKEDFPQLFGEVKVPSADIADKAPSNKPKTSAERLAESVIG